MTVVNRMRWGALPAMLLAGAVLAGSGNTPPVSDAGNDRTVFPDTTVTLDGSRSSDPDGDALTYMWTLAAPAGSAAMLSDDSALMPTFVADIAGDYEISLIVSDGQDTSEVCNITVVTVPGNSAPVADAGDDQTATVGDLIQLDGSRSFDVDGDPLSFRWTLQTPAGSGAVLSADNAVMPTFEFDLNGEYIATLVVFDGEFHSDPDTVRIIPGTGNSPPVADAGPDQSVALGAGVTLDGRDSSDPDGDPLDFAWTVVTAPPGFSGNVGNANTDMPNFVAEVPGTYVFQLIVNDGLVDSDPDTVNVTTENTRPVAVALSRPDTPEVGDPVIIDGTQSSDADGDTLTFAWALTTRPNGSAATIDAPDAPVTTFVPDIAGTYVAQLTVDDGRLDDIDTTQVITALAGLEIEDVEVDETAGTATFIVRLLVPSEDPVQVDFETVDGTATAGEDYVADAGVITFPPGVTEQTITIDLLDDDAVEGEEDFFIVLSNPVNAVLVDDTGEATIFSDDVGAQAVLTISDEAQLELTNMTADMVFTVTLTLDGNIAVCASPDPPNEIIVPGGVTVDYETEDGTAVAIPDEDYEFIPATTLTFEGRNCETRTISVSITGDDMVEEDETFFVQLNNPVGAVIAPDEAGIGTGTIINDDEEPEEGAGTLSADTGSIGGTPRGGHSRPSSGSGTGHLALLILALLTFARTVGRRTTRR